MIVAKYKKEMDNAYKEIDPEFLKAIEVYANIVFSLPKIISF